MDLLISYAVLINEHKLSCVKKSEKRIGIAV